MLEFHGMAAQLIEPCCRVLLALILRGLAPHVTFTMAVDDPERASRGGWVFDEDEPDPIFGRQGPQVCALHA